MSKPLGFEKPLGMRDTPPSLYETKARLRKKVLEEMKRSGYQLLETPVLEYDETVGSATAIAEHELFKLLDQQGRTLVLRPDMTAPIARVVASSMSQEALPLRIAYDTHVFRAQQHEGGHPAEFEQIGIECIGDHSLSADAEVIALMATVLQQAGLSDFQIAVGHIGFVNALFHETVKDEKKEEQLRLFLYKKNIVGFRHLVGDLSLSSTDHDRLLHLLTLRGDQRVLSKAKTLVSGQKGKSMIAELELLSSILSDDGIREHVTFDFTLVSHMSYYTGLVYEGYHGNLGFSLASGGRYDELLEKFRRPAPATGFGIYFDRLIEASGGGMQEPEQSCILYSRGNRKKALMLAKEKRENGQITVLQDVNGLSNKEAFLKRFTEVVDLTDRHKEETAP